MRARQVRRSRSTSRQIVWSRGVITGSLIQNAIFVANPIIALETDLQAQLVGATLVRSRMLLTTSCAVALAAGAAPQIIVGLRTRPDSEPALSGAQGPLLDPTLGWAVWHPHNANSGTGVAISEPAVDNKAMRRINSPKDGLVLVLASNAFGGGTINFSLAISLAVKLR